MVRRRRKRRDHASPAASLASLTAYAILLSFSISPTVAAAAAAVAHAPRRQKLQPIDETPSGGGGGGIGGKGWHTARSSWIDADEGELEAEERNSRCINGDGEGACSANGGGNGNKGVRSNGKPWDGQAWGVPAPALEPSCHLSDRSSDAYPGAVKTIGGTVPDILQDSSWCAGGEDCVLPPATGAGNKKEAVRGGGVGGSQEGTGSCIDAAGAGGGGDDDGEAAACRGESSIPGDAGRVPDDEARASSSGEGPPRRDGRFTTTAAASLADFTTAGPKEQQSRLVDGYATIATAAYPQSRPPSTTEQSSLPTEARPTVATERPPQQEQRGPLVKGQGANTNTRDRDTGGVKHPGATAVVHGDGRTGATDEGARAEEPTPGRWNRHAKVGPTGGSKGKGRRERELPAGTGGGGSGSEKRGGGGGVLETAIVGGKAWPSWRAFACILLLSALVLGTFLRGSIPHWLPFFGGDRRQRWAIDLDSAIAHARSRAGSFCSGRASVFSGDPVDDSDLPDLISDSEEGEDGNGDQGVVPGDDDGETPLMWDRRPKPDDYLVFHPVLGVVPAGVVRAWGGDGCGGWGGVRAEAAGARVGGTNGGTGGKGCGCSSKSSSPRSALAPAAVSSKAIAVAGVVKGKQLPPDEWPEWLAMMEFDLVQWRSGASLARVDHDPRVQELWLGDWPGNTQQLRLSTACSFGLA
ncbi:hypothetical protein Esi_0012_0124 [Ectocarpus siliculosus]|uniref:Uncharacterized protein n=1 Tax=Ectocarpus siliculosus TaxID=2880 RepID=D8LDJ6_ECTSI|nr:hypothetical protein Esi_0012_0124 [Ectocarpus siliculosus]|eukprot:CBN74065.1 hypothetical protein Esi_0012_0124 [Ectocarpus siliculosus]